MPKFTIYMIYHSHIDIGYTERQEKIAQYQACFTKQAVDNVLSNNSFKYTAEGFWAIEQYLKKYKKRGKERLIEAIKTKRFDLTHCYCHFAELLNYYNLNKSLDYVSDFVKENNLDPVKCAMASDINGFSYGFSQALYNHGVRFLVTNINTHHGGCPFGKPLVPFYWKTPDGNKILVWNGLTYHKANLLGLIPGLTPKGDPGVPGLAPTEFGFVDVNNPDDYAKERIFSMVDGLKKLGYQYNFLPLCGSGLYTDNSPVGIKHVELIEKWNKQYGDKIEIKLTTLPELYEVIKKLENIETYEGDWTDWWTDGVISTPDETRVFRNAQRDQKELLLLNKNIEKDKLFQQLTNDLILYAEHTWGHSASLSDPYRLLVKEIDFRKANLAINADIEAKTLLDREFAKLKEGNFTVNRPFKYLIVNPFDYDIEDVFYIPSDFWEEGYFLDNDYYVVDSHNKKYICQRTYTLRGSFIAIQAKLKAKEKKNVKIVFIPKKEKNVIKQKAGIIDSKDYKVVYGDDGIKSIKYNDHEILNQHSKELFGFPVYELFINGKRQDAAGFGYSSRKIPQASFFYPENVKMTIKETGPLFDIIRYEFDLNGTKESFVEFAFYKKLAKIGINSMFNKDISIDPEGMYVAFPFAGGSYLLDKPNTLIEPGNQLPKTCADYYAIDRGVILNHEKYKIAINTLDTPLIAINKIKLWNFSTVADKTGTLFSWVLNNKWETNFRTECAGYLESRYIISLVNSMDEAIQELDKNDFNQILLRKEK